MTIAWSQRQQRLSERKDRLKRLIEANAPDAIIYMAARTLLTSECRNKWLAIWSWLVDEVTDSVRYRLCDLHIFWLRRQGWPHSCAINIHFGQSREEHKKSGCRCDEGFEDEIRAMMRRKENLHG